MNLSAAGTDHPFCLHTAADFPPDHTSRFFPTSPNTLVSSPMMLAGMGVLTGPMVLPRPYCHQCGSLMIF